MAHPKGKALDSCLHAQHTPIQLQKEDEIFDVAQQVYDNLPSSKIASGFIQAHRLAKRIIQHGGDNSFLSGGSGGISTGVTKDFDETSSGLRRKDIANMFQGGA